MTLSVKKAVKEPTSQINLVARQLEHVLRYQSPLRVQAVWSLSEHAQETVAGAADTEPPARLVGDTRYPASRYHSARASSTPTPEAPRAFGDVGVPSPTVASVFGFAGNVTTLESNPTTSRIVRCV